MKYLCGFLLIFGCVMQGQTNLVPNPSFEMHDTCPDNASLLSYAVPWFSPTTGSPDYFDTCNVSGVVDIPLNEFGYQDAFNMGGGYAGLIANDTLDLYREYISVKLTSSLQAGTKYYVTFYVSLADTAREAIDQMGCFFSTDTIKRQDALAFNLSPQVFNPNFSYLSSKTNWMKITGSFVADSAYNFITLGNFADSGHTHIIYVPNGSQSSGWKQSYYFIDNICISNDSLICNNSVSIKKLKPHNMVFSPNPANDYCAIIMNELAELDIYDYRGIKIAEQKLFTGNNIIDTRAFARGIYFFHVRNSNAITIRKVVINH